MSLLSAPRTGDRGPGLDFWAPGSGEGGPKGRFPALAMGLGKPNGRLNGFCDAQAFCALLDGGERVRGWGEAGTVVFFWGGGRVMGCERVLRRSNLFEDPRVSKFCDH